MTEPLSPLVRILATVVPLAAVGWLVLHWSSVDGGADALGSAGPWWLALAFGVASLTWVAGATCQQGSVVERLPLRALLAVQLAGSAANHVLPAGIGVATVNMRHLRRRGLDRRTALHAVGLNTAAGIAVHVVATAVLIAVGAATLSWLPVAAVAGGLAAIVLLAVVITPARRAVRRAVAAWVAPARVQWAQVARVPRRATQLWAGSAAVPVLHALTLWCVALSLGAHPSAGAIFGVYFVASGVSAVIPSPGGFGSLDAALTVGLHATGLPTSQAIAAVLAYRLITVWLPLLPSAVTLEVLRRKALL